MADEPREIQVHIVKALIVDHDGLGPEGIKEELDNANFPNDCMHPNVLEVQTQTVQWTDDHPLNKEGPEGQKALEELFPLIYDDDVQAATIPPDAVGIILEADGQMRLAVPHMQEDDEVPRFVLFAAAMYRVIADMNEDQIEVFIEQMAKNVRDSTEEDDKTGGLLDYLSEHMHKPDINQDENNHYEDYEGEYDGQG